MGAWYQPGPWNRPARRGGAGCLQSHSMQTLTQIRELLAAHQLQPKHKWGQNFLHDQNHMRRIIAAAALQPGDGVLEVGAGTGSLTESLLEAGARVVAVEIDADLAPILHQRLDGFGDQVAIHIGDVMADKRHLDPAVMAKLQNVVAESEPHSTEIRNPKSEMPHQDGSNRQDQGTPPFKLIANLPYGVASPLLSTLALDHPAMELAMVMVQREVADRLTAGPGSKQYGALGVLVQAMCHVDRLSALPGSCFWPQPKVGSAVVQLVRRDEPLADDPAALTKLLHTLFSKRRKQLKAILGADTPLPAGVEPTARPEQLTVDQLIELSRVTLSNS